MGACEGVYVRACVGVGGVWVSMSGCVCGCMCACVDACVCVYRRLCGCLCVCVWLLVRARMSVRVWVRVLLRGWERARGGLRVLVWAHVLM